ncbi:MAG: ribonuclease HII [Nitrospirae bacterium]|nr:ribonuclease HII [Nitrospirota bacterium]
MPRRNPARSERIPPLQFSLLKEGDRRKIPAGERRRLERLLAFEQALWQQGFRRVAGLDEAGRGPLAGPVVAAAVILSPESFLPGLDDSKRLSPQQRDRLEEAIRQEAVAFGVGIVEPPVIDRLNILQSTRLAMTEALAQITPPPDHLLLDALTLPACPLPQTPLIKGDQRSLSIAAASVIAKVTRDRLMAQCHAVYPQYRFHEHKGYPTPAHLEALRRYGPCPLHRKTFRGVCDLPLPLQGVES